LPPAVYDDEPVAAAHLVRVPGCVLVVDGYNASLRRWPDQSIAEQRRRLTDALGGLSARTGVDVHLVFDGAGDQGGRAPAIPRGRVRVQFTAATVEADDAILELVERLPADRAVVVATDDRRVRAEAAARGANVISQEQLFSLL
jgi:predicted RNA-binding protein with PIN domain